jgi:hypothetical protein
VEVLATPVIVPDVVCDQCQQPLIEIDLYGRRWIGCIDCNRWGWPGDSLVRADIAALRKRVTLKRQRQNHPPSSDIEEARTVDARAFSAYSDDSSRPRELMLSGGTGGGTNQQIPRNPLETKSFERRGWDSNPRDGCPPTRVPGVRLRPLGHLSLTALERRRQLKGSDRPLQANKPLPAKR